MADAIGNKAAHDYHLDVPAPEQGFFAKGLGHGDWGAKNRLSRLFNPKSGNTVMLAFDHGYIMGSTAGLERIDVTIAPLCQYTDVLMGTRGAIRACIHVPLYQHEFDAYVSLSYNIGAGAFCRCSFSQSP